MQKILIITVAGTSTRFSRSIGYEVLKCIYSETSKKSILEILLDYSKGIFDKVIIVGGYKYEELEKYVEEKKAFQNIQIVYNDHYSDYGSNYSLYLGLIEALKLNGEIVFAEGDLIVDRGSFEKIYQNERSVISSNNESIRADKSVAFYQSLEGDIKYIYDTNHQQLYIPEEFTTIANSGQIWKFTDNERLCYLINKQTIDDYKDTNLNIIQKYFQQTTPIQYDIVNIKQWYNCNTVEDYQEAINNYNVINDYNKSKTGKIS